MSDLEHRIKHSLEPVLELPDPRPRISAYHDMPYALFHYDPEEEFELRKQVKKQWKRQPDQMKAQVDPIRKALLQQPRIAKYVGDSLPAQIEKVYAEMGGGAFAPE